MKAAQAVLVISPEYNRSLPGVLKNAIDVGSRPYGHNVWGNKPGGLFGASPGAIGTAVMQAHARDVLAAVGVTVFSGPEVYLTVKDGFYDEAGNLNPGTAKFLPGLDGRLCRFREENAGLTGTLTADYSAVTPAGTCAQNSISTVAS